MKPGIWHLIGVVLLTCWSVPAMADDGQRGFLNKVFRGADGEAKYVLFVPADYKGDKAYPLILFLHGAGKPGPTA